MWFLLSNSKTSYGKIGTNLKKFISKEKLMIATLHSDFDESIECVRIENTYDAVSRYTSPNPSLSFQPQSLLLLEDLPSDTALAVEMIKSGMPDFNWEFHAVGRLSDAFVLLDNCHFDAALVDLTLEDAAGPSVMERFFSRAPSLPVIIWTGSHDDGIYYRIHNKRRVSLLRKDEASALRMRLVLLKALSN
jgi:CheY-like chemotaxis protein